MDKKTNVNNYKCFVHYCTVGLFFVDMVIVSAKNVIIVYLPHRA